MATATTNLSDTQLLAMARAHYESRLRANGAEPIWTNLPVKYREQEVEAMRAAMSMARAA